jgi:hypothetical protein
VQSIFGSQLQSTCNIVIDVANEPAAGGAYNLNIGYLNSLAPAQL